jgi:hypothetical protein
MVLEKLTVSRLVNKFPSLFGTRRFISVLEVLAISPVLSQMDLVNILPLFFMIPINAIPAGALHTYPVGFSVYT